MKKTIIFLLTMISSATFCTLRYNPQTYRFYSENAPHNVNQDEYNALVNQSIVYIHSIGVDEFTDNDLATLFSTLRIVGTPAALQLIHDYEEMIKTYKQDLMRLQNI